MNFLRAIIDGVHSEFTTQEVLRKYQLGSSAIVSIVKQALVKKELIEIEKRQAIIPDPIMKVLAETKGKKSTIWYLLLLTIFNCLLETE